MGRGLERGKREREKEEKKGCKKGKMEGVKEQCGKLSTPLEMVKPVRRTLVNLYSTCV
jgi:hypothetical protein